MTQQCERKESRDIAVFDVHKTRIIVQDEALFEPAPHWERWEAVLGVTPRRRQAVQGGACSSSLRMSKAPLTSWSTEPLFVDLFARNPLHEPLVMTDLQLDLDAQCEVQVEEPERVVLEAQSTQLVSTFLR